MFRRRAAGGLARSELPQTQVIEMAVEGLVTVLAIPTGPASALLFAARLLHLAIP